ncbi:unnamed protein product, partial [Prorocentrum cordatum]
AVGRGRQVAEEAGGAGARCGLRPVRQRAEDLPQGRVPAAIAWRGRLRNEGADRSARRCQRGERCQQVPGSTGLDEGICQGASSIRGMDKVSSGPLSLSSCSTPQVVRGAAAMYRKSHNTVKPGEQGKRDYVYPQAVHQPNFRFGGGKADAVSGAGAKLALNMAAADDGSVARTRLAQKAAEDYRHVKHPKPFQKMHYMQGPGGPPVAQDHVFGAKSGEDTTSVEVCIKGCYSLQEQLPDQDLGRCTKLGRRNVTTETRAFGVPSVRADIPGPSSKG